MGGAPSPKLEVKGSLARLLAQEMYEYDSSSVVTVFGRTGAGKSQYAMKVAYQFYQDWDVVLKRIVFTPFDFQRALEGLDRRGEWIPVLVWDDAGPWLELLKRNSWHPLAVGVRGAFETARLKGGGCEPNHYYRQEPVQEHSVRRVPLQVQGQGS